MEAYWKRLLHVHVPVCVRGSWPRAAKATTMGGHSNRVVNEWKTQRSFEKANSKCTVKNTHAVRAENEEEGGLKRPGGFLGPLSAYKLTYALTYLRVRRMVYLHTYILTHLHNCTSRLTCMR